VPQPYIIYPTHLAPLAHMWPFNESIPRERKSCHALHSRTSDTHSCPVGSMYYTLRPHALPHPDYAAINTMGLQQSSISVDHTTYRYPVIGSYMRHIGAFAASFAHVVQHQQGLRRSSSTSASSPTLLADHPCNIGNPYLRSANIAFLTVSLAPAF
jgi:hypothetical protein